MSQRSDGEEQESEGAYIAKGSLKLLEACFFVVVAIVMFFVVYAVLFLAARVQYL